ncbi:transposase [Streptomyces sp. NPDC058409]|uniref:transposase n=1 Tax=Streptomyces sp. NPDC058409 TaxID=3346484 RepID=UPI0036497AC8
MPETWAPGSAKADPDKVARRTACQIPDGIGHVEKWQFALDMLDETRSWGIEVPLAIADAGYGDAAAFRLGLQARGLNYVVGIFILRGGTAFGCPRTPAPSRPPLLEPATSE